MILLKIIFTSPSINFKLTEYHDKYISTIVNNKDNDSYLIYINSTNVGYSEENDIKTID